MILEFKRPALEDLASIQAYIGARNPRAAARMAQELLLACEKLELFPDRGRGGLVPGTRELTTVWPYIIVYRHTLERIDILRIWHGAQNRSSE